MPTWFYFTSSSPPDTEHLPNLLQSLVLDHVLVADQVQHLR